VPAAGGCHHPEAPQRGGFRWHHAAVAGRLPPTVGPDSTPAAGSPFDLWDLPVSVHLVLFVHRVTGLEPGLYLGAEAAGMRATGIGCYFDDVLHHALGLQDRTWQSLYHFTIGTPVDDPRLRSAPPYGEERTQK